MWDGAIAGYNRVRAADDASSLAELQRAGAVQGLVKSAIEQEAAARLRQREGEFRSGLAQLGENPTHDQVRNLALKSGMVTPKDLLANDLGIYKADSSRELALSRLAMQKQNHDQQYELNKRKVTNAEQAAQLDAWYKSGNMAIKAAMAKYNLPPDIFDGASIPAAPTAPEAKPATIAPTVTPAEVMRISDPAERAQAMAALQGGRFSPEPAPAAPTAPVASPSPTPAPAVLQPKPPVSAMPNAPTAPVPTAAATDAPKPLTLADAPAGLSRKDAQKWLLAQSKAQSPIGNRESVFLNRIILSGNEAARDLENVTKLPMSASTGILGGRGQEQGIMNAVKETLANKMTSQDVQSYNVLSAGFQRSLAAIESAGLAPSGTLSHQMDAVIFKEGDTNYTKLQKLAQTRQIVEAGLETVLSNPRIPPETRKHVEDIVKKVEAAVPFTQEDLIKLKQEQGVNPKITLKDVISKTKPVGAAPAGVDSKVWGAMTPEERALWK